MYPKAFAGMVLAAGALATTDAAAVALDFTDALVSSGPATTRTIGWRFNLLDTVTVDALGVFDLGSTGANTLVDDHEVAIWLCDDVACQTGTLQASATVAGSGSPSPSSDFEVSASGLGTWILADVPDVVLLAGDYVIGAYYPTAADAVVTLVDQPTLVADPALTYTGRRFTPVSGALAFPVSQVVGAGFFGPTFQVQDPGLIPVPGTAALFGLALMMATGLRFRGRR